VCETKAVGNLYYERGLLGGDFSKSCYWEELKGINFPVLREWD